MPEVRLGSYLLRLDSSRVQQGIVNALNSDPQTWAAEAREELQRRIEAWFSGGSKKTLQDLPIYCICSYAHTYTNELRAGKS